MLLDALEQKRDKTCNYCVKCTLHIFGGSGTDWFWAYKFVLQCQGKEMATAACLECKNEKEIDWIHFVGFFFFNNAYFLE